MKIPKSVLIGGVRFKIRIKKMESWGEMHFDDKEIHISRNSILKEHIFLDTLRHEMLHASLSVAGTSWSDKYDEESIVRAIENIFFPAFNLIKNQISDGI